MPPAAPYGLLQPGGSLRDGERTRERRCEDTDEINKMMYRVGLLFVAVATVEGQIVDLLFYLLGRSTV